MFAGLRRAADDSVQVIFTAPLHLDSEYIGALEVVLTAHELLDIAGDRTGLGETGEILIAQRSAPDSAILINSTRYDSVPPLTRRIALDRQDDPVTLAVLGRTRGPAVEATDSRGERVWAATRHLPQTGWGLVVQLDAAEQERAVLELRGHMIRLAVALSAFAILTGTILALRLATPIRELARVADRIRAGDLDARAEVRSGDEIGALARTFNLMAAKLIETNRELQRRVENNHARAADAADAQDEEGASSDEVSEREPPAR